MALNLDDEARARVASVLECFGVPDVEVQADGSLSLWSHAVLRLSEHWCHAEDVREAAAERGVEAAVAAIPEILSADADPRWLRADRPVDMTSPRCGVVPAVRVIDAVVALDLAARLDTLAEASDPVEELRFLLQAGERRDFAELGDQVAVVAGFYGAAAV